MIGIDLSGKTALVMGVTNGYSLGWAIGEKLLQAGAKCMFSYQGERLQASLEKLLTPFEGTLTEQCDVTSEEELQKLFARIREEFGGLDYIVHAIGFAPRASMEGRFIDTTGPDWNTAMSVSAYSLVSVARHAEPLWNEGGSMVTLTYYASQKVVPKYNVMGVAKAALEASTRYLASELGSKNIRVNAISAGPMRTVAAKSIPGFSGMLSKAASASAMKRNATAEEVGNLGLFLLCDLSSGITGEITYVDAGYNIMGMSAE